MINFLSKKNLSTHNLSSYLFNQFELIKLINHLSCCILFITFFLIIINTFKTNLLPDSTHIHSQLNQQPQINKFSESNQPQAIKQTKENLTAMIYPQATYSLTGLVVADHNSNSFLDITHKNDPFNTKDLCLVWGHNLNHNLHKKTSYYHGDFTCYISTNFAQRPLAFFKDKILKRTIPNQFDFTKLSNNHLIPATKSIAHLLEKTKTGDQIVLSGYLVNYSIFQENKKIFNRKTSLSNSDQNQQGTYRCEIIYVTDYQIIKSHNQIQATINNCITNNHHWLLLISLINASLFLISKILIKISL